MIVTSLSVLYIFLFESILEKQYDPISCYLSKVTSGRAFFSFLNILEICICILLFCLSNYSTSACEQWSQTTKAISVLQLLAIHKKFWSHIFSKFCQWGEYPSKRRHKPIYLIELLNIKFFNCNYQKNSENKFRIIP